MGLMALTGGAQGTGNWVDRIGLPEREMLAEGSVVPPAGVCVFALRHPKEGKRIDISLASGVTKVTFQPEGAFPVEVRNRVRTMPPAGFEKGKCGWVSFLKRGDGWNLYWNETMVARIPVCWEGPVVLSHPQEMLPKGDLKDEYAQKLGAIAFSDNFLVPPNSDFPATWERLSGVWKLHSVTGSVSGANTGYKLARQPLPQKSPNFYTLEGGGTNALVLAGEPFYSRYRIQASVQHNSGTNGIVFLAGERGGYYAFTAQTDPRTECVQLDLWKRPANPAVPAVYLHSVLTQIPVGQWLLLEVRLREDRVVCLADHIEVIHKRLSLPPAGRFGLFSNGSAVERTRFDDVVVSSHDDLFWDHAADLQWDARGVPAGVIAKEVNGRPVLSFAPSKAPVVWSAGDLMAPPRRLSARFVSQSPDFLCGLGCGVQSSGGGAYRFTCRQSGGKRDFVLEQIGKGGKPAVLDRVTLPAGNGPIQLALDALQPHELRAQVDGKTVCFARPPVQPGGTVEILAGGAKEILAEQLSAETIVRTMVERFEKNPLYVNDPFMRHWASPEGQWVTLPNGQTWFKGDLTGPTLLRLPFVEDATLHLGVPEEAQVGGCRLVFKGGAASLFTMASGTNATMRIPAAQVPLLGAGKEQFKGFLLGIQDRVLWLGGETSLLGLAHLPTPLPGRRLRVEGFTLPQLAKTLVKRENVFDTLFNESLHDWTINGGRWEVINRFYCEPTWSHMNGENATSMAALWSKYVFSGDFSVDFYAGLRMGWYGRPGDLNLSVMSPSCSPSDGYTAITTGWDPDHSELFNRLFRQGKQIWISTKYTVPRYRDGLVRRGYQPLVAKGRDIHGAWYEMQFRRMGKRLIYRYDNEEVFRAEDPNPLQEGALGIWTFQNSMMVARIKIAAESIRPRPFGFSEIPAGRIPLPLDPGVPDYGVRANGRPVQYLRPAFWEGEDAVSHPLVRFEKGAEGKPEMRVTSLLGGGSFFVRSHIPPAAGGTLLGWRFEIARHPAAQVNFEFSSTYKDKEGKTHPAAFWSHILSGSDEWRGPRQQAGRSEVAPSTGSNLVWTAVDVWIPDIVLQKGYGTRLDGFGNLQPSDVQQGLFGNVPRTWFAIRNFREIHKGIPKLSGPAEKRALLEAEGKKIAGLALGKRHAYQLPSSLDATLPQVDWLSPAQANFPLCAKQDPAVSGTVVFSSSDPWPTSLLPPRQVLADGRICAVRREGNTARVFVPHEIRKKGPMTFVVTLSDGRTYKTVVDMTPVKNEPPVLLSLKMPEGGVETFEARPMDLKPFQVERGAILAHAEDPGRGGVLQIGNNGYRRRLSAWLSKRYDPVQTPVVQFQYKGAERSCAALNYGPKGFTFTESFNTTVRHAPGATPLDHQWHTWIGIPQDNEGEFALSTKPALGTRALRVGSRASPDPSGLYSQLWIDQLALGPAVGPKRVFAFQANYADPDGVAAVEYAILQGATPAVYAKEEIRKGLAWLPAKNEEVTQPDLSKIPEGIHHLLVRAKDKAGVVSEWTDLPFLHDKTPPKVTYSVNPCADFNGSELRFSITDPVAPPVLSTLNFACLGRPLPLAEDFGTLRGGAGTFDYRVDWIWTLRKELSTAKQGALLPIQISGIADAAGNLAPPFRMDIKVDFENDKREPTVPSFVWPGNLFFFQPVVRRADQLFAELPRVKAETAKTPEGEVLSLLPQKEEGALCRIKFPTPWDPDKYPWVAISFRCVEAKPTGYAPFSLIFNSGSRRPRGIKDVHPFVFGHPTNSLPYLVSKPLKEVQPGEWVDVLVQARDFLRSASESRKETPDVTFLTLAMRRWTKGKTVQIRSFSILAPWNSDHFLAFRPYDLNGVRGLFWQGGESAFTGIRPANVAIPAGMHRAFRFWFCDKKGNRTSVWTIPVPPDSVKSKPALAGLQKVEY